MQSYEPPVPPHLHVRGNQAFDRHATPALKAAATLFDCAVTLTLFFWLHRLLRLAPIPSWTWPVAITGIYTAQWTLGKLLTGHTLGDMSWSLGALRRGIDAPLMSSAHLGNGVIVRGIFLTGLAIAACAWATGDAVFRQPLWTLAQELTLNSTLPDTRSGEWEILPFYYTLGAWPRTYAEKPIFYTLPYEKGPPSRFPGHLIAIWEEPTTRLTVEGPKTPPASSKKEIRTPRARIRECLVGSEKSWTCLKIRETTLQRHLNEIQTRLMGQAGGTTALQMSWALSWFTVHNPALPTSEQVQGIYLSAETRSRGEDRFVVITEQGTHQAIILDYPVNSSAPRARKTLRTAIASLRVSDDLGPGRSWINRQLQAVELRTPDPARIAAAQASLIAKISVEPTSFEAFYHLGGTAVLLDRYARQAGSNALDMAAVARPLIENAWRYARDIAPNDSRTTELEGFWLEARKR
ncbi:hypothetical protein WDW37_10310 [Bdellovibrionota bacterium FG-1]